jgi:L-asparagine transporter-like permease
MIAISMFGALFTWLMIFVTHLAFRRKVSADSLAFRAWGHPFGSLLGALLLVAVLITTAFTDQFRMTLAYGIPFLVLLVIVHTVRNKRS